MFSHHYDYYYYMYVFFYLSSFSNFFLNLTFLIISSHIVFVFVLGLLNRSLWSNICADSLRRLILQCSSLSIILTLSHKGKWFPLSFHIWSAIPVFSISPRTTAFRYSSSLIFSGRHVLPLYILYHNCKGWSTHSSWSCWILLVAWRGRDTSGELSHLWILSWYHMDYISFGSFHLWHRADIPWWVFGYCPLSSYVMHSE